MENLAGTQDENQDRASAGREQAEGLTKPRNGPGTGQQPQASLATAWGPTWLLPTPSSFFLSSLCLVELIKSLPQKGLFSR